MVSTVDERGRIVLPKDLRQAHGLTPGRPVIIESSEEGLIVRPALPLNEALDRLTGAINDSTRRPGARAVDPLDLKRQWEPSV